MSVGARAGAARLMLLLAAGSLAGCGLRYINPELPEDRDWRLLRGATRPRRPAGPPASGPSSVPASRPVRARSRIVAVFDLEDRGAGFAAALRGRLTAYLAARLAATGRLQVVPREQLRLRVARRAGPGAAGGGCTQRACQIEVGREVAAEVALSTVVMRLGSRCQLVAVLYDLRRAVAVGGASAAAPCDADGVTLALDGLAAELGASPR